ncbi:MAG: hypothetical protein V4514_19910 [Pseudomonadota bacterium]|uniref:hypothetical protein n=1 Tax=Phenylobacterium sp. TaxID=1871053 RepID=UPI0025D90EEC|nr:hypothetical protein [Phenylobacterium sp.]MBT9472095.1 hypothetical protein [Phenylobacterium sp.]
MQTGSGKRPPWLTATALGRALEDARRNAAANKHELGRNGGVATGTTPDGRFATARISPAVGTAWKMIDEVHARSFESGVLVLGRYEDYQALENGRADGGEGRAHIGQGGALTSENPAHHDAIARVWGVPVAEVSGTDATIRVSGNRVRGRLVPTYCFCMSEANHYFDPSPDVPKALYEVSDIQELGALLLSKHRNRLFDYRAGMMQYVSRSGLVENGLLLGPSAFAKAPEFAAEKEVRIAFKASGPPYERIVTEPDPEVGALFRRIK